MWVSFSLSAGTAPGGASPGGICGGNKFGFRTSKYNALVKRRSAAASGEGP